MAGAKACRRHEFETFEVSLIKGPLRNWHSTMLLLAFCFEEPVSVTYVLVDSSWQALWLISVTAIFIHNQLSYRSKVSQDTVNVLHDALSEGISDLTGIVSSTVSKHREIKA